MTRTTRRKPATREEIQQRGGKAGRVMLLDISDDASYKPPSDVHETPDGVIIRMELPGVSEDEIDILVRGGRIEVAGEKRPDSTAADASYLCLERPFGRFHRAFDVSGSLNLARMTALLKGGVLVLFLPKIEERRGHERRIPILTEEPDREG